jgi:hypothetical protein
MREFYVCDAIIKSMKSTVIIVSAAFVTNLSTSDSKKIDDD